MKKNLNYQSAPKERFGYGLYYFAQNIFYTFVTTYVATYLLNNGMNEAAIAAVLLAPKVWDAVNDPIFGVIVDKLKMKNGRFLPWIKLSVVFIPLTTVALFAMPSTLSDWAKSVWVIVAYILWDMSYTMCDAPIFALATTMTSDIQERASIYSMSRFTGTLGSFIPMVAVPLMYGENGLNLGWFVTAAIVCSVGFALMLPICFTVKERSHATIEEQRSVGSILKGFAGNKFLLVFYCCVLIINVTNTIQVLNPIFCQYVLGNETLATGLLVAVMGPILIDALVIPKLTRKIDKFYLYVGAVSLYCIISFIQYFIGYENMPLLIVTLVIKGIGLGGMTVLGAMFTPDCVEYGHYKSGQRNDGISFSIQTFVNKLVAAIVTSLSMAMISAMGFDSTNVTPDGTNAVWFMFTLFASIGSAIAIPILLCFYKLRDKDVRLMSQCNNGEISKEDCQAKLSDMKKYY